MPGAGVLILTTNRVGTFDKAFKSRIQLTLYFGDLSKEERLKIWHNYFHRLQELNEQALNFGNLMAYSGRLAETMIDGRGIRNAITTALQLSKFDGIKLTYDHLMRAIEATASLG